MAKRKKRKAAAPASGAQEPERAPEKSRPKGARVRKTDPVPARRSRVTLAAGIFFALLMGLFLGSLIPGILGGGQEEAPEQPPAGTTDWRDALPAPMRHKLAQLEKKVGEDPAQAAAWTALGNLYFDAGRSDEAIHAYTHALQISPDNPDVLSDLGIMYRELGQPELALDCFRKASALDPAHQNSVFNQGVVLYFDLNRRSEAMEKWRSLLRINPDALAPDGKRLADMLERLAKESGQESRK